MKKDETPKHYQVYCSITGKEEHFDCARRAGEAFYRTNAKDRPSVFYGNNRSSRKVAGTMIIGDDIVKSLPFESDPDFAEAYLQMQATHPTP